MQELQDTEFSLCKMTGQQYRAAFTCMAKKDVRYYLNGIFISVTNSELAATNGHILYYATVECNMASDDTIFEPAKISASVHTVGVSPMDDGKNVKVTTINGRGNKAQYICRVIDGRFPDYRAIANDKKTEQAFNKVAWDSKYLALLKIVFESRIVRFEVASNITTSKIQAAIKSGKGIDEGMGTVILMPCNIKHLG